MYLHSMLLSTETFMYLQGSLGEPEKLISKVTVLANDDPYGVYIISSSARPLRVQEKNSGRKALIKGA